MRKLGLLLLLSFAFIGCEDDCLQSALCTKLSDGVSTLKGKVDVCHNGISITIDYSALKEHLRHGDSEGKCVVLDDGGLVFRDGENVLIDCNFNLPFLHTRDNGEQWFYE